MKDQPKHFTEMLSLRSPFNFGLAEDMARVIDKK